MLAGHPHRLESHGVANETPGVPRLLRLDRARVDLGGQTILDHIDFELDTGQVVGVTGPNGSGKTTLMRVLATLLRIDAGTGAILGADLTTDQVYGIRGSIGLIGHNPALLSQLSLRENLEHAARLTGIDASRVERALHTVGLEDVADRSAGAASFGMKRRLEVARLLLTRPRLLLLDEATSGLDVAARALIDALIERTLNHDGGAVIVSHDNSQLADRCESVSHLSFGHLESAS